MKFEIEGTTDHWRWRLVTDDGEEVIAVSKYYRSHVDLVRDLNRINATQITVP